MEAKATQAVPINETAIVRNVTNGKWDKSPIGTKTSWFGTFESGSFSHKHFCTAKSIGKLQSQEK